MKKEIWKDILGYEGLYQVSNFGRVKSLDRWIKDKNGMYKLLKGKFLKVIKPQGYIVVRLFKDGKSKNYQIHRLVAQAFLEIPKELRHLEGTRYLQVNHKDEDKNNNNVDNLEWCDGKYNCNYGNRNKKVAEKLSKPVLQYTLDGEFVREWKSTMECGRNGYLFVCVSKCCLGKQKSHKGFIFKYKEDI